MKKFLPFSLIALSTIAVACSSSRGATEFEVSTPHDKEQKRYQIGDKAQGGIVILVNENGTHGLVAAGQDQFENSGYNECADMMNNPLYHDNDGKKYFDWRLPKVWEAFQMYLNLHVINQGDFSNSGYWTSQGPSSFEKMSLVNFSNGLEFTSLKIDTYRARAVRSF
jgi:hypothetical protein